MKRRDFLNSKKSSGGGGYRLTKLLNKDVKELNGIILSLFCVSFLLTVGLISYKVNSSYAIFTDTINGEKTIELTVPNICNEVSIVSSGDTSGANAPVLSENMIPVYYDTCDEVWKKADESNQNSKYVWYDYDNKMWANSVTVSTNSEGVRTDLTEAPEGTEIPMDRILTMQVWIPRYKYTVWNYNLDGTVSSEPQEINIEFENGTTTTGEIECADLENMGTSDRTASGTESSVSETCIIKSTNTECTDNGCNGKTYTHPAFTFGDEELKGFWIGKFELSSDVTCTATTASAIESGCNLTSIRPLVKPNIVSWRGAMVSIFENNIMAMNNTNNKYGFEASDDTHMIKNMEWGAVAYLSHSKYGINKDVALNSNSNYITGCGPQSQESTSSGSTCSAYNTTLGQRASTTGNIYGIYDMSSGSSEFTMSNMIGPDGNTFISGNLYDYYQHSGYNGILYENGSFITYKEGFNYPEEKYYDKYSYGANDGYSLNKTKLGDSIKETRFANSLTSYTDSWYNGHATIPTIGYSWIIRGFESENLFSSVNSSGISYTHASSRLVISQ